MKISDRVARISPSPTMEGAKKAARMRAQGLDVLSFAVGEPDFPTPDNVVVAAKEALDAQKTKYTNASGIDELKQAVVDSTAEKIGVDYSLDEVCVSNGAKHALSNVFATLLDPGDEVIMLAPYWVTYPELIGVYGGSLVDVMTHGEQDFQPDLNRVADAVTEKTAAICINSPNNPTGSVISEENLQGLADIVVDNDLVLVSDEIYKDIMFDGMEHTSPASLPGMKERTIIVDGVAKSYAMTGWRIGWTIGDAEFVGAIGSLQSQQTSNANSIAQWAAVEALTGPQDAVEHMRSAFEKRRDYIIPALREIPGVKCAMPHGAFYAFPDISSFFGETLGRSRINSSQDMTNYLLEEGHVSCVHGAAFGANDYMRLSFACSMEQIEEGIDRIAAALST